MGFQKKTGKGRIDKWYRLAKEKGYRARAAFKLIQLNRKYGFLERSQVLLDLCAAPGSWCQVAAEFMPQKNSIIVGVDLTPIKAIPRVITFQSDITTDKCRSTIRQHLKTWKADTVLHDGAPNVGTAWIQDAFAQAELVLQALKLACDFLIKGGTFVTKVFRSKDYNALLWVFNQLFQKVEATKPPSSRNVSAEIFVVCRGFKAPAVIDNRLLDLRTVFAELAGATPNHEAKVFNPEIKKRKREGYEEGDYTQHKEVSASDFIESTDPIAMLATVNRFSFDTNFYDNVVLHAIKALPETTADILHYCSDLKVLGRKEFRQLLRWRLRARSLFDMQLPKQDTSYAADTEVVEVQPLNTEADLEQRLDDLRSKEKTQRRKEERRARERRSKEMTRLKLNMVTPTDIGLEQDGPSGKSATFRLSDFERSEKNLSEKDTHLIEGEDESAETEESEPDSELDDEDALEGQLDVLYNNYRNRKSNVDEKLRQRFDTTEFEGFEQEASDTHQACTAAEEQDSDAFEIEAEQKEAPALTMKAASFFSNDIFKDILSQPPNYAQDDRNRENPRVSQGISAEPFQAPVKHDLIVEKSEPYRNGGSSQNEPSVEIITAEAMTLAHQLAKGDTTAHDLTDAGYNKYLLRDRDGLPEWFLDDEGRHSRLQRPITAAGAAAIKEKLRALNARPIKKVQEAKDRKRFKAAQKLEKLRKKSALLAEEEGVSEKDKAANITKLLRRASKKKPKQQVRLVVARGNNRGISGRPRGVKGKYKIVDKRLKKDTRALKRLSKKSNS